MPDPQLDDAIGNLTAFNGYLGSNTADVGKGDDLITGKPLSTRKRVFNFVAAAADLIGAGVAGRLLKGGGMAAKAIKGIKHGGDAASAVNKAEDVYTITPFLKPPFDAN